MPSFVGTPLQLVLSGGSGQFTPARFSGSPLALRLTSGSATVGPTLSSSLDVALAAVLDTLFASESIVDQQGRPTRRFQEIWRNAITTIKEVLTSQGLSITELQAIYAAINTAQSTAAEAVQQAQATESERALAGSYTNPVGVVTASSSGTVTIAAHERIYEFSDGTRTTVDVDAGSVTGFSPGDAVTVYYSDPSRAGGTVAYQGTTLAVSQSAGVHIVGQAPIPAVGEPDVDGSGPTAPGWKVESYIDPRATGYNP